MGDYYADSRGFAGITSYGGQQVRFHHDVGEPGEDEGFLRLDGDWLIEEGTNPDGSTFREVWNPLPNSGGPCGAWQVAGCQVVQVGPHIVYVDSTEGRYFRAATLA
ncbi:hypothetical protein [Kitasatospora griseola]|uniref:hypothetical protein n=1 Tax=Kitasatospora griseola TaxID=2064 RepID=UPI00344AF6C9